MENIGSQHFKPSITIFSARNFHQNNFETHSSERQNTSKRSYIGVTMENYFFLQIIFFSTEPWSKIHYPDP